MMYLIGDMYRKNILVRLQTPCEAIFVTFSVNNVVDRQFVKT